MTPGPRPRRARGRDPGRALRDLRGSRPRGLRVPSGSSPIPRGPACAQPRAMTSQTPPPPFAHGTRARTPDSLPTSSRTAGPAARRPAGRRVLRPHPRLRRRPFRRRPLGRGRRRRPREAAGARPAPGARRLRPADRLRRLRTVPLRPRLAVPAAPRRAHPRPGGPARHGHRRLRRRGARLVADAGSGWAWGPRPFGGGFLGLVIVGLVVWWFVAGRHRGAAAAGPGTGGIPTTAATTPATTLGETVDTSAEPAAGPVPPYGTPPAPSPPRTRRPRHPWQPPGRCRPSPPASTGRARRTP